MLHRLDILLWVSNLQIFSESIVILEEIFWNINLNSSLSIPRKQKTYICKASIALGRHIYFWSIHITESIDSIIRRTNRGWSETWQKNYLSVGKSGNCDRSVIKSSEREDNVSKVQRSIRCKSEHLWSEMSESLSLSHEHNSTRKLTFYIRDFICGRSKAFVFRNENDHVINFGTVLKNKSLSNVSSVCLIRTTWFHPRSMSRYLSIFHVITS